MEAVARFLLSNDQEPLGVPVAPPQLQLHERQRGCVSMLWEASIEERKRRREADSSSKQLQAQARRLLKDLQRVREGAEAEVR